MAHVFIKFLKILFLGACIWLVIASVDVDNVILLFDFPFCAGPQNVVISIGGCFRNVPVVELRIFRNFQDFAFLGNEVGAELPDFFVLIDTVDDKGNIECGVISCNSKISIHSFLLCLMRRFSLRFCLRTEAISC